jgi:hypothetical protein
MPMLRYSRVLLEETLIIRLSDVKDASCVHNAGGIFIPKLFSKNLRCAFFVVTCHIGT